MEAIGTYSTRHLDCLQLSAGGYAIQLVHYRISFLVAVCFIELSPLNHPPPGHPRPHPLGRVLRSRRRRPSFVQKFGSTVRA